MGYHRPGSLSVMWPLYCSIFFEKFGVLLPLFALLLKILASPNRARMISIFCYVLRQSLAVLQSLSLDDFSCHMLGCKCITIIYFKCATLAQCTTDEIHGWRVKNGAYFPVLRCLRHGQSPAKPSMRKMRYGFASTFFSSSCRCVRATNAYSYGRNWRKCFAQTTLLD